MSLEWINGERVEEIRIMDIVAPDWKSLGIALGFTAPDLETIEQRHSRDPSCCIQDLFSKWFRQRSGYSWKMLIEALEKAKLTNLASDLQTILPCKRPATEH